MTNFLKALVWTESDFKQKLSFKSIQISVDVALEAHQQLKLNEVKWIGKVFPNNNIEVICGENCKIAGSTVVFVCLMCSFKLIFTITC